MTYICVSKQTIIGSDNGWSPSWRQAIIWTNVGILLIRTLGTNFSEILSEIHNFLFRKIQFKMSSGKLRPSCLGLNVLTRLWVRCVIDAERLNIALIAIIRWITCGVICIAFCDLSLTIKRSILCMLLEHKIQLCYHKQFAWFHIAHFCPSV